MPKNAVTLKSAFEVTPISVLYSNFVANTQFLRYSTCNYTVTLKSGSVVTQGHRNRHVL